MRTRVSWFLLVMAFSCAGAAAQQTPSARPAVEEKIDPSIAARLPKNAKVHLLTNDEFKKLVAKTPLTARTGMSTSAVNSSTARSENSILMQLNKQKQNAEADLAKVRGVQPARTLLQNSPTLARAPQPTITPATGPSRTTGLSKYSKLPAPNLQINGCYAVSGGLPAIGTVTGQTAKLIFTPMSEYNLYTIHGCNFGDASPNAKAWIYALGFHADFHIEAWGDDTIVMKLGENISGVPDIDNVSLVVQRADGKQVQATGFRFFAARDEKVPLKYIPPAWRKLDFSEKGQNDPSLTPSAQDNSPVNGPYVPPEIVDKASIFVLRYLNDKYAPGVDSFDLSQLPKGWVVETVGWQSFDGVCPGTVTYKQGFGQWNVSSSATDVTVSWADTSCSGFVINPILGFPTNIYQKHTFSIYAVQIFLRGPRGTESALPHP